MASPISVLDQGGPGARRPTLHIWIRRMLSVLLRSSLNLQCELISQRYGRGYDCILRRRREELLVLNRRRVYPRTNLRSFKIERPRHLGPLPKTTFISLESLHHIRRYHSNPVLLLTKNTFPFPLSFACPPCQESQDDDLSEKKSEREAAKKT